LPAGFLLISKPAFLRSSFFKYFDKPSFYTNVIEYNVFNKFFFKLNSFDFFKKNKNIENDN
jgi:hypothetical protein